MRTTNSISAPPEIIEYWRIMASETTNPINGKPMKKNQWLTRAILYLWKHWAEIKDSFT